MEKRIALFEVKALDGADPNGEFEAILSVPTIDRDGEVIDGRAFEPLPAEIPVHKFHDFCSPVASATPFYEGDVLKARGTFDPDPESQTIRSKIGRSIRYMSVGFMAATRSDQDGTPHITKAELLEASFVSVPSNREAAILAVKAHGAGLAVGGPVVTGRPHIVGDAGPEISINAVDPAAAAKAVVAALTKLPAATDPEETAAPEAAVDPPADVPVGQVYAALARAQAALLTT